MDAAPPHVPEEPPASRDWSLVPLDALASVFVRVGAVDVLMGAGLVCRSWLQAANLPDVWRVLDMENHDIVLEKEDVVLRKMAKAAVDRSKGQLQVFAGKKFVTDELLCYIVERSPSLTSLRLVSCCFVFTKGLVDVTRDSPLLELRSLQLDYFAINVGALIAVLDNCPVLEVLTVRDCFDFYYDLPLRKKFSRIKTMTIEFGDVYAPNFDSNPFSQERMEAPQPPHRVVHTAISYCKGLFKGTLNKLRSSSGR